MRYFVLHALLKILLWPFSLIYGAITWFRNLCFDIQLIKPATFDEVKTICIGNLCAGGSGKTPHTEYILNLLQAEYNVATLSRGYKRETSGFYEVQESDTPAKCGDEPLQIKQKHTQAIVTVDESRVKGIKKITEKYDQTDVVLLDDAFQHRTVKCGLNILLTEYNNLFTNDILLPAGRLRESAKGYLRADVIIVTKTPEYATPIDLRGVLKEINPRPYQNLYFSYLKYGHLYHIFNRDETFNIPLYLFKYQTLILTGIANPGPMLTYIKEYANEVIQKQYPDHHSYTYDDIQDIINAFQAMEGENKMIITTEKDATRLISFSAQLKDLPIFALPIEIDFKNKTEEFNEQILKYVRTNKIHHRKYT